MRDLRGYFKAAIVAIVLNQAQTLFIALLVLRNALYTKPMMLTSALAIFTITLFCKRYVSFITTQER